MLAPGVNFINIFYTKVLLHSFSLITFGFEFFAKAARKMLMKLTTGDSI